MNDVMDFTPVGRSPIQEFYCGERVFITGGTGFIGKVIIEKLLRTCPSISKIFMLVRPKKGQEARKRVDEILDSQVSTNCSWYLSRIQTIHTVELA